MKLMFFCPIKYSPKSLIRDLMLTQHMSLLMRTIFLSHLSILLILDGKQIHASFKSITLNMETIVKLLALLKHHLIPKRESNLRNLLLLKHSSIMRTLPQLGMKPRNINPSLLLMKFQMINYQRTSIGETSRVLISQTHTEIKVIVVPATLFHSLKLLK